MTVKYRTFLLLNINSSLMSITGMSMIKEIGSYLLNMIKKRKVSFLRNLLQLILILQLYMKLLILFTKKVRIKKIKNYNCLRTINYNCSEEECRRT